MLQIVISWLWRKLLQVWSKKWCALSGLQGFSFSLSHHCWSFTIVNHLYESDLVSSQGVRLELVSGSRVLCCGAGPGSGLQTLAGHKTTCFLLPLTIPLLSGTFVNLSGIIIFGGQTLLGVTMGNVRTLEGGWMVGLGEGWDGLRAAVPPLLIDRQCQDKTTTEHLGFAPSNRFVPWDFLLSMELSCPVSLVRIEDNIGKKGRFENIRQSRMAEDTFDYFYVL